MAIKGVSITITYRAWNTDEQDWQTGDAANHTIYVAKDGVPAAATNAPVEVDATNMPGEYKLVLTDAEMTANVVTVSGVSSTADVKIFGVQIVTEQAILSSAEAAAIAAESAASAAAADAATIAGKLPAGSIGDATAATQASIAAAIAALNNIGTDDIKGMIVDGITLEKLLTVMLAALFGNSTYDTATNTWTIKNRSGATVGTIRYTAGGVRVESTLV